MLVTEVLKVTQKMQLWRYNREVVINTIDIYCILHFFQKKILDRAILSICIKILRFHISVTVSILRLKVDE